MAAGKPSNKWSSSDGYPSSWNCSRSGSPDHTGSERKCLVMMGTDDDKLIMDAETGGGGVVPKVGGKRSRKGAAENGKGASSNGEEGCGDLEQAHILTERERRKKMRNMFSGLHALLPQLPPKADKCTIVDEALKYIKTLQQNIQMLEKQKLKKLQGAAPIMEYEPSVITSLTQPQESREAFLASQGPNMEFPVPIPGSSFSIFPSPTCFQTWSSPNVVMSMYGDDAHISVCSARKPGLLNTIFYILEKHNLDVVSAHISSDFHGSTYMIHAHAGGRCHQYPEALSVEDTFKLAAGEMNLWLLQSGNWSIRNSGC